MPAHNNKNAAGRFFFSYVINNQCYTTMAKLLAQTDTTLLHVNQVQYGNRLFFFSLNTNHAHKQTPTNRIHLKKKKNLANIPHFK